MCIWLFFMPVNGLCTAQKVEWQNASAEMQFQDPCLSPDGDLAFNQPFLKLLCMYLLIYTNVKRWIEIGARQYVRKYR